MPHPVDAYPASRSDQLDELRALVDVTGDIADALSAPLRLVDALRGCASALARCLDAAALIWVLDEDNALSLQAIAGPHPAHVGPVPSEIMLIARQRRCYVTEAAFDDVRVPFRAWARSGGMSAFAGHPLIDEGRAIGVLALFAPRPFSAATLHTLGGLAESIARGIGHWRAVEALRLSEERFALAVRGTDAGVWDWEVSTNKVYMAPRFKELLGYRDHEMESSFAAWDALLHPDDRVCVMEAIRRHFKHREPYRVEYRLRTKSGAYRWYQARGQALWGDDGRAVRMLGSITDATARKAGEQQAAAAHRVACILAEAGDVGAAMPCILRSLCESLGWVVGEYWVRDEREGVLRREAFAGLHSVAVSRFEAAGEGLVVPSGIGLAGRVWAVERAVWVRDVAVDPDFPRAAVAGQEGLHGAIAMPIIVRGELRGVMKLFGADVREPEEGLIDALDGIAKQVSRCMDLQREQQSARRHQHESAIARRIQQRMFPRSAPVLEGYEFAGASRPAAAAGGDYFDFIPCHDGPLLAIGDVAGHGFGPALVMATARAYIRALAATGVPLDSILGLVNSLLAEDTDDRFMTLFLGRIDPSNQSLAYGSAGHCLGVVLDTGGEVRAELPPGDPPLGVNPRHTFRESVSVQLLPGDLVLLLSDGVLEAGAINGEAFGLGRTIDVVRACRHQPPESVIATLLDAAYEFSRGCQHDDMTAIVMKVG